MSQITSVKVHTLEVFRPLFVRIFNINDAIPGTILSLNSIAFV